MTMFFFPLVPLHEHELNDGWNEQFRGSRRLYWTFLRPKAVISFVMAKHQETEM